MIKFDEDKFLGNILAFIFFFFIIFCMIGFPISVFTLFIGMIFPAAGPTLEFILYDILSWPIIIASAIMSFYYIYLN